MFSLDRYAPSYNILQNVKVNIVEKKSVFRWYHRDTSEIQISPRMSPPPPGHEKKSPLLATAHA